VPSSSQTALSEREPPSGGPRRSFALGLVERVFRRCPPYTVWRSMAAALRGVGVRMGKSSVFWGLPSFGGSGDVSTRLSIGEHCGFNLGCHFELDDTITIEDHVSVGHQVMFLTRRRTGEGPATAPVRVGAGAWLGARCVVMPGVSIGAGSVIGASVVVSEDVPPNVLLSGGRKISIAKWR
jgi:maltose O-acetyltransferase